MFITKNSRGDTIVEVLISISIAGLAIGMAYSISHVATLKAVAARERDKAVGLLEGQVTALKLREQADPAGFPTSSFATSTNYCLDATANNPSDPATWNPVANTAATPLTQKPSGNYDSTYCVQDAQDKIYYLNITTVKDTGSSNQVDFRLDVRWPRLGAGTDNDATFYYRF